MRRPEALVETSRNRHLRRVDWRFLLPDPTPARTLCLATGSLADGLTAASLPGREGLHDGTDRDENQGERPTDRRCFVCERAAVSNYGGQWFCAPHLSDQVVESIGR